MSVAEGGGHVKHLGECSAAVFAAGGVVRTRNNTGDKIAVATAT